MNSVTVGWEASASAWINSQGESGDCSRRDILDPCLKKVLGDVSGLQILDVGCGEGRYARKLAAKGALVTGIDPTGSFITRARELDPRGTYIQTGAESLPLPDKTFDITISYLSIVDIPDYRSAIREMARVTKPNGRIVVATVSNVASTTDQWVRDAGGAKLYRTVDRYMDEFELDLDWQEIRIVNYHRPLSAILGVFFESGLVMDNFLEPLPSPDSKDYIDERRVPTFQVMTFRFGVPHTPKTHE